MVEKPPSQTGWKPGGRERLADCHQPIQSCSQSRWAKEYLSVLLCVICISPEPLIRSTSHLAGVLQGTQGCAVLNLVQFGHASTFNINKPWIKKAHSALCSSGGGASGLCRLRRACRPKRARAPDNAASSNTRSLLGAKQSSQNRPRLTDCRSLYNQTILHFPGVNMSRISG